MNIQEAFNFSGKQLRVSGTVCDPLFCGRDCALILGYVKPLNALKEKVKNKHKFKLEDRVPVLGTLSHNEKKLIYITEAGLYELIFGSKLESAEKFKDYVFEVVLPSIRKNGYYVSDSISDEKVSQLQEELRQKNIELEKSHKKMLRLQEFIECTQELKKEEIFYIATTQAYASQNRFKYGGIARPKDLKARLACYNTGRAEGDLYYFCNIIECHKYKDIEQCLESLARGFKDKMGGKKEMVRLRYNDLLELVEFILDNNHKRIDFMNDNRQRFMTNLMELDPIIPLPIEIGNHIVVSREDNGKSTPLKKIDVSDWDEDQIQTLIKKLINSYAQNKGMQNYNFDTMDNDDDPLTVYWKEFSERASQSIQRTENLRFDSERSSTDAV